MRETKKPSIIGGHINLALLLRTSHASSSPTDSWRGLLPPVDKGKQLPVDYDGVAQGRSRLVDDERRAVNPPLSRRLAVVDQRGQKVADSCADICSEFTSGPSALCADSSDARFDRL